MAVTIKWQGILMWLYAPPTKVLPTTISARAVNNEIRPRELFSRSREEIPPDREALCLRYTANACLPQTYPGKGWVRGAASPGEIIMAYSQ